VTAGGNAPGNRSQQTSTPQGSHPMRSLLHHLSVWHRYDPYRVDPKIRVASLLLLPPGALPPATFFIPCGDRSRSPLLYSNTENALGGEPEAYVFTDAEGKPLNQNWLRRGVLYPALRKAGLPIPARAAGFHAFRHSAASLIAAGGNLKLAQVFLGHSHLSTTADFYTHTSTTAERAAAQTLEDAIFGSVPELFPAGFGRTSQVTDNRIVG
jgi:integrase